MITRASSALPRPAVRRPGRSVDHGRHLRGIHWCCIAAAALLTPGLLVADNAQGSASPAARAEAPLVGSVQDQDTAFAWNRTLPPGSRLEVKGVVGDIRAVAADGREARVTGRPERADGSQHVEFRVVENGDQVTICAVYPGTDAAECIPGREIAKPLRQGSPSVDFMIEVPRGVHLLVATRVGEISVVDVDGDVEAYGVVGPVRLSTSGAAQAETVTGDIHATLGRTDWSGTKSFRTVSGNLLLELPPEPNTTVSALAALGEISSVFPLSDPRLPSDRLYRYPYQAEGVLGAGGRHLVLEVARGSIYISHPEAQGNRPLTQQVPPRSGQRPPTVSPRRVEMSLTAARALLGHQDPETRGRAVIALQNHGGREASDLLRPVLLSDPDARVRQRAAFSLGQIGELDAVRELSEAVTTDRDASVRQAAAYSLGVLADPGSEPTLLRAVEDPDPRVSQTAIWALGELTR